MRTVSVLIIEDDSMVAETLKQLLQPEDFESIIKATSVSTVAKAKDILEGVIPDIILLDLNLTDSAGIDTLITIKKKVATTPIIVITGLQTKQLRLQCIEFGAQDCLIKGIFTRHDLLYAIMAAVGRQDHLKTFVYALELQNSIGHAYQNIRNKVSKIEGEIRNMTETVLTGNGHSLKTQIALLIKQVQDQEVIQTAIKKDLKLMLRKEKEGRWGFWATVIVAIIGLIGSTLSAIIASSYSQHKP